MGWDRWDLNQASADYRNKVYKLIVVGIMTCLIQTLNLVTLWVKFCSDFV